jgi:hypothetical protein
MFNGVRSLELIEHTAIESGAMDTRVVYETRTMDAVVGTAMPEAYDQHQVAMSVIG